MATELSLVQVSPWLCRKKCRGLTYVNFSLGGDAVGGITVACLIIPQVSRCELCDIAIPGTEGSAYSQCHMPLVWLSFHR